MESKQEIISSLKFIGSLKPGDKINTKFMFVQPDGILTRISRTLFSPDNRNNALNFLSRTIRNTLDLIDTCQKSSKQSDKSLCLNIIKDLENSKRGLNNMKITYSDDLKFNCDIDTILQDIDNRLPTLKLLYRQFREIIVEEDEEFDDSKTSVSAPGSIAHRNLPPPITIPSRTEDNYDDDSFEDED